MLRAMTSNNLQSPERPIVRQALPVRSLGLVVGVAILVIMPFVLFGEQITAWTEELVLLGAHHRAVTGAVLFALLSSDIVLPVPSSLVSTACGMTLGFVAGSAVSFAGMCVSVAVGYLLGRFASAPVGRFLGVSEYRWLCELHEKHGLWLLLALRPVPVMAETSIVFAGVTRQRVGPVGLVAGLGNLVVSGIYAAIGVWGALSDSFLPAFGCAMLLAGAMLLALRYRRRKRSDDQGPGATC